MKFTIAERTINYHYVVYYTDENGNHNLGDIYFNEHERTCKVRFYGWSHGIPLEDLSDILEGIADLNVVVMARLSNG